MRDSLQDGLRRPRPGSVNSREVDSGHEKFLVDGHGGRALRAVTERDEAGPEILGKESVALSR